MSKSPSPGLPTPSEPHSGAWTIQVWLSFLISIFAMTGGIVLCPADLWVRGYLFMGLLFTVGSTISLTKTMRDNHEASKLHAAIKNAQLERILADADPLK